MLGWRPTDTILGVSIQAAQSSVGNVLYKRDICPPMDGSLSTRNTCFPESANRSAASMPAIPAPTTRTACFTSTWRISRGTCQPTRRTAADTSACAFSVAASGSSVTHEQCSRIFVIWKRKGLSPASEQTLRKVPSCMLGVHEATITRLRPTLMMSSAIRA